MINESRIGKIAATKDTPDFVIAACSNLGPEYIRIYTSPYDERILIITCYHSNIVEVYRMRGRLNWWWMAVSL